MKILIYLFFLILCLPNVYAAEVRDDVVQTIHNQGVANVIINLDVSFDLEPSEEEIEQARRLRSLKAIEPNPELSYAEKLQRIAEAIAPVQDDVLAAVAHLDASQFTLTTRYTLVAALVAEIGQEALDILRQHPKVTVIQINAEGSASLSESVPLINADDVHALSPTAYTGEGVAVAVLDSGIDTNHADFNDGAIIYEKCFVSGGGSFGNKCQGDIESNSAEDDHGHGTHVSGIITSPTGVAPDSDIVAIKVINNDGGFQVGDLILGTQCTLCLKCDDASCVSLCANSCPANSSVSSKLKIMNMSLGLNDEGYDDAKTCDDLTPSFTTLMSQLVTEFDVTVFVASGNDNRADKIDWPSCLSDVIAVGNSKNSSDELYKDASNGGNRGALVKIVAPGESINSTKMGGGHEDRTGTSMSSPTAAAVAALMLEKDLNLTPALIKQKLIDTGVEITDNLITYKRVDALAAVQDETTQAILQLTHNSMPYQNGETYDLGVFNQNIDISKQFKLFNLGNAALTNDSFDLANDNATLDGTFPTSIAANSSDTFTLIFPTSTQGTFTDSITFNSNDSNNSSFTTTLEWLVCDGVLPVNSDFNAPTGCWEREVLDNPKNGDENLYKPITGCIDDECSLPELIAYSSYSSEYTVQFNSSHAANWSKDNAQAQLISPAFSTVGNDGISISFAWYERQKTGSDLKTGQDDADKVTVQWSEDRENWIDIQSFNCQTSNTGWQDKNMSLPDEAEGKSTVYINFLFDADDKNAGDNEDCFLANVAINEGTRIPEIAIYANSVEVVSGNSPNLDNGTNFGDVERGTTQEQTFIIKNIGQETLNLTGTPYISVLGEHPGYFTVTQPASNTVNAGEQQTFKITFSPTRKQVYSATLKILNGDMDESPYYIQLKGNGTNPPLTLNLTKTQVTEGSKITGTVSRTTTSADITVNLSAGSDKLSISPATLNMTSGSATSSTFTITAVDDEQYSGDISVNIQASAVDYEGDSVSLNIIEDEAEPKSEPISLPPPQPDYVAVFIGSPNGRVISEPEGIDCNKGEGSCWHIFPRIDPQTGSTTRLTLNTIAPEGLYFDSWAGDSDCHDSKLYLNNTKACLAYFYGIRGYQAPTQDNPDDVSTTQQQTAYLSNVRFTGLINQSNNIISQFDLPTTQSLLLTATANDAQVDPVLTLETNNRLIAQNDDWKQAINYAALEQTIFLENDSSAALLQSLNPDIYSIAMTAIQSGVATLAIQPQDKDARLSQISTRLLLTENTAVNFSLQNVIGTQTVLIKTWGTTPDIDPAMQLTFNNRVLDSNDNWQQTMRVNEIPVDKQPSSLNDAALLVDLANADYALYLSTANNMMGQIVVEIQLLTDEN